MTLLWWRPFNCPITLVRLQTFRDGFDSRPKIPRCSSFVMDFAYLVLAVAVATSRTTSHFDGWMGIVMGGFVDCRFVAGWCLKGNGGRPSF